MTDVQECARADTALLIDKKEFESPFFREFQLTRRVGFVSPEVSFAHLLDHGPAGIAPTATSSARRRNSAATAPRIAR